MDIMEMSGREADGCEIMTKGRGVGRYQREKWEKVWNGDSCQ